MATKRKTKPEAEPRKAQIADERDPYQRVVDSKRAIMLAAGALAEFGERYQYHRLTLAARVLDALNRSLNAEGAEDAVEKRLERAAATLLGSDRQALLVARPGDKAPIAEALRERLKPELEGHSPAELAQIMSVIVAMTPGNERIFGRPNKSANRAELWEPHIRKVLANKADCAPYVIAAEIIKACAKASGYRARTADLFPNG